MKRYQCIRKCHAYGKKWIVGEVFESSVAPNHHFKEIAENPISPVPQREPLVPPQLKGKAVHDPMRPLESKTDAIAMSQLQGNRPVITTGMAAKQETPIPQEI